MVALRYHNSRDPQNRARGPIQPLDAPYSLGSTIVALLILPVFLLGLGAVATLLIVAFGGK